jgi:hypothetical protein
VTTVSNGEPTPLRIAIRLNFENANAPGLGAPLPQGVVRVYARGADGALALVGEDRMAATAAGKPVTLTLGQAFDVTAERRQTSASRPCQGSFEAAEEIVLRNAKKTPVTVTVVELLSGDWRILEESDAHEAADAGAARWHLEVPALGERKLAYRVLTRF